MKRIRRWVANVLAILSAILCLASAAMAIHACYYSDEVMWWGPLAADGHQDLIEVRPWVGQGQIIYWRSRYALKDQRLYVQIFHIYPGMHNPTTGFEFRKPVRWPASTAREFRKEHILFGLFAFEFKPINFDLARDIGHSHIYEKGGQIYFPLWVPVVLFGLFPGILFFRRRRERKRSIVGFCAVCGYDLRATPDRCPECGAGATKAAII